jgi:hypothetical protein
MPERIQRKREKGWRIPENAVSVTRPGRWGNPFKVGSVYGLPYFYQPLIATLENYLTLFGTYALAQLAENPDWLRPLRGKDLACFCPLDQPCHADILLRLANQ